jgi:hypothetical protein
MTREEKSAHWRGALEGWRGSGQSQARFCGENNLSLFTDSADDNEGDRLEKGPGEGP